MTDKEAKLTHYNLHVLDLAIKTIKEKNKGVEIAAAARGVEAAEVQKHGNKQIAASKASKAAASVANKNRPANQYGRNLDPHSARSSMDPDLIYDLLMIEMDRLKEEGTFTAAGWGKAAGSVIDKHIETCLREAPENHYTNQDRMDIESFRQLAKDRVSMTTDPDLISIQLNDLTEQFFPNFIEDNDGNEESTESGTNPRAEAESA